MNKPSWNDAPEWAKYLAMDKSGEWYWHEYEPQIDRLSGDWNSSGMTTLGFSWKISVEERPEEV